jgi:hypothetical protein
VADEEHRTVARVEADLLHGGREILGDVVVDVPDRTGAEMPRTPMAPEIEVEDVEPLIREMIREAASRQVPRVAILPEPVDEQHRRAGTSVVGREALPHHRERYLAARDHELLHEGGSIVAVDRLLEGTAVEDHEERITRGGYES